MYIQICVTELRYNRMLSYGA